jgi:hypothetical protein
MNTPRESAPDQIAKRYQNMQDKKHFQEVVAMPALRPELLALSLEALANALARFTKTSARPEVHIYADTNSNLEEMDIVRDTYLPEATLFHAKPHVSAPSGTWNILNAIKNASRWAETVYLVEEDVLIYPYFFEWHQSRLEPASCGRRMPRYPNFPFYTNPGSCLRRPLLDKLVPHINDFYFENTDVYCHVHFPPVHVSTLDDGLIRRVLHVNKLEWVFPPKPVCAHVGLQFKFDIYQITGNTLQERIQSVRKLVADPPERDRYARLWEPFQP